MFARLAKYRFSLLACLSIAGLGCDKNPTAPQQTFELTPAAPSLFVGGSIRLEAKPGPDVPTSSLKWSTSDQQVVSVDGTGLIKGVAPGTATVRASTFEGFAETKVNVVTGGSTLRTSALTTCGIDTGSALYCWGNNSRGQAGLGNTVSSPSPMRVGSISFSSVSVGWEHACAISQNVPYCWGLFTAFLIPESQGTVNAAAPYRVDPGMQVAQIEAGGAQQESAASCSDQYCASQTCVLSTNGDVACWAATGFSAQTLQPDPLINAPPFTAISIGRNYGCGLTADHLLYCWGGNGYGQAGAQPPTSTLVHRIGDGQFFQAVSAGSSHTCAIDLAGDAWCWGANSSRQLGAPSTGTCPFRFVTVPCRFTPAKVEGGFKFQAIAVGTSTPVITGEQQASQTCGITVDLSIVCWGDNFFGELGNGTTQNADAPMKVNSALTFRSITAGYGHSCAVSVTGEGFCWGRNSFGELGTGNLTSVTVPTAIAGGLSFK